MKFSISQNRGDENGPSFRRIAFCVAMVLAMLIIQPANVALAWYHGEVERIFLFPDGFILTLRNSELADCKHGYVYFRDSVVGEGGVNRADSLALTARQTNEEIGVVIDKAINGPGGYCNANGSIDMGRYSL